MLCAKPQTGSFFILAILIAIILLVGGLLLRLIGLRGGGGFRLGLGLHPGSGGHRLHELLHKPDRRQIVAHDRILGVLGILGHLRQERNLDVEGLHRLEVVWYSLWLVLE